MPYVSELVSERQLKFLLGEAEGRLALSRGRRMVVRAVVPTGLFGDCVLFSN